MIIFYLLVLAVAIYLYKGKILPYQLALIMILAIIGVHLFGWKQDPFQATTIPFSVNLVPRVVSSSTGTARKIVQQDSGPMVVQQNILADSLPSESLDQLVNYVMEIPASLDNGSVGSVIQNRSIQTPQSKNTQTTPDPTPQNPTPQNQTNQDPKDKTIKTLPGKSNQVTKETTTNSGKSCEPNIKHQGLVPSGSRGLTGDEHQSITKAHNEYRDLHGANQLQFSQSLANDAQTWADNLASNGCKLQHQPGLKGQGENLAFYAGRASNTLDPVRSWYSERCDFERLGDYDNVPVKNIVGNPPVGHFTQVIWGDTKKVGCGFAKCPAGNQEIWVCRYDPQGNFVMAQPGEPIEQARKRVYKEQLSPPTK